MANIYILVCLSNTMLSIFKPYNNPPVREFFDFRKQADIFILQDTLLGQLQIVILY